MASARSLSTCPEPLRASNCESLALGRPASPRRPRPASPRRLASPRLAALPTSRSASQAARPSKVCCQPASPRQHRCTASAAVKTGCSYEVAKSQPASPRRPLSPRPGSRRPVTEAEQIFRAQVLRINRLMKAHHERQWQNFVRERVGIEAAAALELDGFFPSRRRKRSTKRQQPITRPLSEIELNRLPQPS
jgi:hypothetical protein